MKNPNYIPQEEFERIEEYILGNVSPEEIDAFESEMKKNADLRQKYLEVKKIISGIEEVALRNNLEIFHQEIDTENQIISPNRSINFWPWVAAAAIALCIATAVWVLYPQQSDARSLFAQYYQEDPGLVTAMSSETNYEFDRAMVDYKSANYKEAIGRWEKLIQVRPENDTIQYFLGASHLALKNADPAITYFEAVANNEISFFQKDAIWYLGLAYILEGKNDQAVEVLEQSQDYRAIELLKELTVK
ncbi:tetratricopeptide repeat protein [Algoriphagus sp.]|uniref:tetratricopeptide repeat protein n=1 Tax=Algoriphagus sp. TaxID=1872435 RepID=UPI00391DFB9E